MDTEPRDSHADVQDDAPNEPNEFGFAGEGTGPEPARESATGLSEDELAEAEQIAVPAGDITGALTGAVERVTDQEPDQEPDR